MQQNQDIIRAADVAEAVVGRRRPIEVCGVSGSERAFILSAIQARQRTPMLVVAASPEEVQRLADDLRFFCQSQKLPVEIFPSYHLLPFKFLSYHNQTASERIRVLYRLMSEAEPLVVVTTIPALLQRLVPRQELSRYAELIQVGEEIEREQLIAKLISGGYLRTAIVEEPGDFSVRGGIVDVFSPLYPDPLRRITFYDTEHQRRLVFLTNNFALPAITIARLYKCRWQVELFFKWIKQHLRIKGFYGTSPNAVKTQVWIAISVYVLVAIVRKELKLERSLYEILQILSVALFEKTPIFETLQSENYQNKDVPMRNQLSLFDL